MSRRLSTWLRKFPTEAAELSTNGCTPNAFIGFNTSFFRVLRFSSENRINLWGVFVWFVLFCLFLKSFWAHIGKATHIPESAPSFWQRRTVSHNDKILLSFGGQFFSWRDVPSFLFQLRNSARFLFSWEW